MKRSDQTKNTKFKQARDCKTLPTLCFYNTELRHDIRSNAVLSEVTAPD